MKRAGPLPPADDRPHPVAAAGRAGAGAQRGLPASRHQARQHPARCCGQPDADRFRRLARGDGGPQHGAHGDLHAGLCRGRADDLGQAGPVDRHLRPLGHALSRHHRQGAAQRLRPHARRRLRAAGQDGAAGLCPRACWPASMPDWPCAPATGRRASPAGGRSWARRRRSTGDGHAGDRAILRRQRRRRRCAACAAGRRRRPRKRGIGLWIGVRPVCCSCWPAATTRWSTTSARATDAACRPIAVEKAAQDAQTAAEAQRLKDQEELARLRADNGGARRPSRRPPCASRSRRRRAGRSRPRWPTSSAEDEARQKARPKPPRRTQEDETRRRRKPKRRQRQADEPQEAAEATESGLRSDGARPPACAGRAEGAGLRHRRHRRHLRRAHARDDRGLAKGAQRSGDRLPDGRPEPGPAA